MDKIATFPPGTIGEYDYVVMLSSWQGKYLLSRHRKRDTWEMQGGHIEAGESPEQAAKRELYEEAGVTDCLLKPLCDYQGEEPGRNNYGRGMVFEVFILGKGALPKSEIKETAAFDEFPENLTYPEITSAIRKWVNINEE